MKSPLPVTIIGVGNLGRTLAAGLQGDDRFALTLCGRTPGSLDDWRGRATVTLDVQAAVRAAAVVLLVVKPKDTAALLAGIAPALHKDALVVSCAAGVSLTALARAAQEAQVGVVRVARAMPNIGATARASTTAVVLADGPARANDEEMLRAVFGPLGDVLVLPDEESLHAVTVAASSGPALMLLFVEALRDAGIACGLNPTLALQAARGALWAADARLAPGADPGPLRASVTSPQGITAAALSALDAHDLHGAVSAAMAAGIARSKEMTSQIDPPSH
jgi:pyrroline-5-carboxylate reductase